MISIHLSDEAERAPAALAETTGQPVSFYAERAIREDLDDLADFEAAERELEDVRAGRSVPAPLADMLKTYGVSTVEGQGDVATPT